MRNTHVRGDKLVDEFADTAGALAAQRALARRGSDGQLKPHVGHGGKEKSHEAGDQQQGLLVHHHWLERVGNLHKQCTAQASKQG